MHREISDQTLDQLVDGELNATERRGMLEQLENTPGGWRRCALAFLEAQTWRTSLQELTAPMEKLAPQERETRHATTVARRPDARLVTRRRYWAAIATSIVAGFCLARFNVPQQHPAVPAPLAEQAADVVQPNVPSALTPANSALANLAASNDPLILADTTPTILPEIWTEPLEVPRDVKRSLKTMGMELRHHNGLAPAQDLAGQPVWVPYRDVTIVPTSHREMF